VAINGNQEFSVRISADTKMAQSEFNKLAIAALTASGQVAKAGKDAESGAKGFESLAGKLVGIRAAFDLLKISGEVFHKVAEFISEPIKMAAEAEQGNNRLVTSLDLAGYQGEKSAKGIHEFSESLRDLSGIDDDLINQIISTNVAIGMTIPQAEEAAQAAAGLAKFTGVDLVSANHQLIGSLSGMTREIQKVDPAISGLTLSQLRQGDAIKLVNERMKSFIEGDAATAVGVITRLKVKWEDLQKAVGGYILTGLDAKGNFASLAGAIDDLGKFFTDNKKGIEEFARTIAVGVVEGIKSLGEIIKEVGPLLPNLGRQFADLTKFFILPFINIMVSASSIIAHFSGDKKLEDAMDRLREKLTALNAEGIKGLTGGNATKVDWDEKLNTSGLKQTLDTQAGLIGGAKERYDASVTKSFAAMGDEQRKGLEQSKANLNQWSDLFNRGMALFRAKAPTIVETPHPEKYDAGPPRSAMTAMASAPVAAATTKMENLGNTGKVNLPMTRDIKQSQLEARRSLAEQMLAIDLSYGDKLLASKIMALKKVGDAEKDAAIKGISVIQEATALKIAIEKRYQYDKSLLLATNSVIEAKLIGDRFAENAALYDVALIEIQQKLDQGVLSAQSAAKAVGEAARAKDAADLAVDLDIASRTGDLYEQAALHYEQDAALFQEYLDEKLISQEAYDAAMGRIAGKKTIETGDAMASSMSVSAIAPPLAAADKIVDAIQALLDFVPNLLNKVAHIFDTLRDLPIKLAEGIANVFSSYLSYFSNISQNFAKAFDKLFDGLTNFIDKLPDAMGNMIKNVPAIFNHIVQKIPALLGAIMKSSITEMPVLAMSFMMALVQGVPSFVHAFIDSVTKELPKAFKESLEAAFTELAGMFHELMGGAKFKLPDISKQIAHVTNAIKGSASQLFNIQDFKTAAKGVDIGDKIAAAIRHSMFDLARMMGELWRFLVTALKAAWQWVYDKIIAPIWELVTGAWRWVYDTILSPIISAFRALWQTAWDLLTGVINLLSDGFRAVVSWLVGAFTAVWDGLRQAASLVGATLVDAWRGFEHLVNVLASVFIDAAHLFDPIVNFRFPEFHWPALPELTIQKPSWWNLSTGGPVGGFGGVVSNTVSKAVGYVSSRAHFEGGGVVRGGVLYAAGGTEVMGTDTVPAMLTPGEFVINRHAASRVGMPNLERLNSGQGLGGGGLTVNAPITINTTQSVDASFIRQTLVPTLLEAIKSATENGRYVINQKGIRA